MKKIYALLISGMVSVLSFGQIQVQQPVPSNYQLKTPVNAVPKPTRNLVTSSAPVSSFIMDYDSADSYSFTTQGDMFRRFIWDMNWNYVTADSSLRYVVVAFDTINDTYNGAGPMGYSPSVVTSVRVDSIFVIFGQENNSSTKDTLIVKLMNVNINGYPSSTVHWADTIIFPDDVPHGTNWLQARLLSLPVNGGNGFTLPGNAKQFSVRLEYKGDKQDTLGVIAGFQGPCGSSSNALIAYQTQTGRFKVGTNWYKANSFALWSQYGSFGTLPTTGGANIYYDCDNSGNQSAGDGANYIQDLNIMTYVTINTNIGLEENFTNGIKLGQNMPNPFAGNSTIAYELEKTGVVTFEIMDITGKKVLGINEGSKSAGKHNLTIDGSLLSPGVYFYTLNVDGNRLTKKMTKTN
jgi:hypothetical protein